MIRTLILSVLFLAGCRTAPKQSAAPLAYPLRPPATFGASAEFEHFLRGTYREKKFEMRAAVKIEADEVLIIGLTPIGTRAFAIRYDGATVQVNDSVAEKIPFPPELIIADFQLMFWPALPDTKGWRVTGSLPRGTREVFFNDEHIATVRASTAASGERLVELTNHKYKYNLSARVQGERPGQ